MDPYLSQITIVAFNVAPPGWAMANGQLLPRSQNEALFALLQTTYGGDGENTFALPNLQGRVPVHVGGGLALGQAGGSYTHTLNSAEALHHHPVEVSAAEGVLARPSPGAVPARAARADVYGSGPLVPVGGNVSAPAGGGQPHDNVQPYTCVNFIIALEGNFPTQS